MTIRELRDVLRGIGIEPTPGELADALWLASLAPRLRATKRAPSPPTAPGPPEAPGPPVPAAPSLPTEDGLSNLSPRSPVPESDDSLDIRLPEPATTAKIPPASRAPVQAVASRALKDPLPLTRALRPLRRQLTWGGRVRVDEEATADLGAQQRLWLPVLIPSGEPALDLALVIDTSESMALWDGLIREFRALSEQLGAFRDIRSWYLVTGRGDSAGPAVRGASPSSALRDPRELLDPTGRRLILVVTDGVHPWWRPSGPLRPILAQWSAASPAAIVQPFPQRLWARSALRPALAEFRASGPGRYSTRLIRSPHRSAVGTSDGMAREPVVIPILELTPTVLERWTRLVGGLQPAATLAAAILTGESEESGSRPTTRGPDSSEEHDRADPAERVRALRASVSPDAYRLAGYLSVVAPLSLPVMRLVVESMLREAGSAELAEVFLSGLLRRLPDISGADTEYVTYGFVAGTRDVLLSTVTRSEALTLLDRVGSYLISGSRNGRPFPAILASPSGGDVTAASEQYPPFGRVAAKVLQRLGGPFGEAVQHLAPKPVLTGLPEGWLGSGAPLPYGKITQPVLFVGLGGTGCDIGAELERSLREEICGPDGRDFVDRRRGAALMPYQLPSCVQFVYADLNQAELDRLPLRVVPGPEHVAAARQTAHYVRDLVPDVDSYPDLARILRLSMAPIVDAWLPSPEGEPRVNPLRRGSGQFPTIGRAALFGMFRSGIDSAVRDISQAIRNLADSGEDLYALGGRPSRTVDVFVAFSVAGGTGAGIFYDYLHLIGDMFSQSSLKIKIYPLVIMPSAFDAGLGGGRRAELNAAPALLDLFRLVDQQNGIEAGRGLSSRHDLPSTDSEEVAVRYPKKGRIALPPGIVQTGILFSRPIGGTREDMYRSVVSLVMSMIGTGTSEEIGQSEGTRHSFADIFAGATVPRQVRAVNGIGRRGVSTALTASLRVPNDELAGIIGARLLRAALEELSAPVRTEESNRPLMEEFLVLAGIHSLLKRPGQDFAEPALAHGARLVTMALLDRREAMQVGLSNLRAQLARDVPPMAAGFDPAGAIYELLGRMDIFRAQRILSGHFDLSDEVEKTGVTGFLQRRCAAPSPPRESGAKPPPVPELRDRLIKRVGWTDEAPVAARRSQDTWYLWSTQAAWAEAWAANGPVWHRSLDRTQSDLTALTRTLTDFARRDHEDFDRRVAELYRKRVGVSYLLPSGVNQMEQFYSQVVRRLRQSHYQVLRPSSSEADLVNTMIGADGWRNAYRLSTSEGPERAIAYLLERVRTEVKSYLQEPPPGELPILPRLVDLLVEAARHETAAGTKPEYLDEFLGKLAGLVPANFTPQGSGPLQVLIYYPAEADNELIREFLHSTINIPIGPGITHVYRNTHAEAISVLLFRTAMGITEVQEARDVLRLWAEALTRPEPTDQLRWRQRTGYHFGYLATREEDRVEILHRLLCAFWNGRAFVQGPETSPERVSVELGGVTMTLPLTPLGLASSWGSLLRAYELWALDDDDIHLRFCAQLMRELPDGLDTRSAPPSALYRVVRDLAEGQIEFLDDLLKRLAPGQRTRAAQMRAFWSRTLPAALDQEFTGPTWPIADSLRRLEEVAYGPSEE